MEGDTKTFCNRFAVGLVDLIIWTCIVSLGSVRLESVVIFGQIHPGFCMTLIYSLNEFIDNSASFVLA